MKFKNGDKVRWLCPSGYYVYGQVTVPKEDESKVMFEGNEEWEYWYYPNKELELVTEDMIKDDRNHNN